MVQLVTKYRGTEVPFPQASIERAARRLSPRALQQLTYYAEREMRKYLTTVVDALEERHGTPYNGSSGGDVLHRRSGAGMRSLRNFIVLRRGDQVTGHVRLNKYMKMHEHGGWIRAKNAQYLTIPLPPALNANGTPKKASARDWDKTFIARSRRGNLIIFRKEGRGVVPLYVLKKKVRIPARLGLRKELRKQRTGMRRELIARIKELTSGRRR